MSIRQCTNCATQYSNMDSSVCPNCGNARFVRTPIDGTGIVEPQPRVPNAYVGHTAISGGFCTGCGSPKIESGKFCPACGKAYPVQSLCPTCGQTWNGAAPIQNQSSGGPSIAAPKPTFSYGPAYQEGVDCPNCGMSQGAGSCILCNSAS